MSSKVIVRYNHGQRLYLHSPHKFCGDEIWPWGPERDQAHVFENRKAAKDTIRSLTPMSSPIRMRDLTFEKAPEISDV